MHLLCQCSSTMTCKLLLSTGNALDHVYAGRKTTMIGKMPRDANEGGSLGLRSAGAVGEVTITTLVFSHEFTHTSRNTIAHAPRGILRRGRPRLGAARVC